MIKDIVEKVICRAGAHVRLIGSEEKSGRAVIYPLISETDFSDRETGSDAGSIDSERFAMICAPELVDAAQRGESVICRGERYVILSVHIMPYGEYKCYAQCFLKRYIE